MCSQTSNRFSPQVRARPVRLVLDHEHEHLSRWATIVRFQPRSAARRADTFGVGEGGGGRQRQAGWRSDRDGREAEGPGAREPGASTGERDLCAKAECALGLGLHLRVNLDRLRLRRLRDRCLCPSHRGLAGHHGAHTRASCSMRCSRPCTIGGPSIAAGSCITATGQPIVSIKYTERLAEAGVEPSVGSVGDSYDNALAETINGLYKAEIIHRRGPWRSFEAVEFATLEWVDWFNNRRLLEPIGNIPPAEAEQRYYAMLERTSHGGVTQTKWPPKTRGGSAFSGRLCFDEKQGTKEGHEILYSPQHPHSG